MTRRMVLSTGAAAMAAPLVAKQAAAGDTDVVVIGAGAAGINAARHLIKRGLSVTVLEANNRIGGRVHTDTAVFGVPYDVGAHWLHNREDNSFVNYGLKNGFDLYEAPEREVFYIGNRIATKTESREFRSAMKAVNGAMLTAGRRGRDVAPSEVIPDVGAWAPTVDLLSGAFEIAKDLNGFSCKDWYSSEDGTDWYCREGFGSLFIHRAKEVPVSLNTKAEKIRWGAGGVTVETNQGNVQARAVVITVSTGVLGAQSITFDPPLPHKKREAVEALSMGHYNHVVLQLKDNFFGIGDDGYFAYKINDMHNGSPQGFAALVNASGHGLTYCEVGGGFAKDLSDAGAATAKDFVVGELKKTFGADIDKSIAKSDIFDWTKNPYTGGAYSAANPGGAWARAELRRPEAERLWFAGEATSPGEWATVSGAHKSGKFVAKQLARVIKPR